MTVRSDQPCGETSNPELQLWLSPSFPVGSFAYSHGLEWAVGSRLVHDRTSALDWLCDLMDHGTLRNDAIVLHVAWRAARERDCIALRRVNELALALCGSRERYLETTLQGNAFVATIKAAWSDVLDDAFVPFDGDVAYAVAVGAVAGSSGVALSVTLNAYLAALTQNLVSALVRMSVIGQTDGQRILAALLPKLKLLAGRAATLGLDDLGGAAFMSDFAAMAHETQDTRLFRS